APIRRPASSVGVKTTFHGTLEMWHLCQAKMRVKMAMPPFPSPVLNAMRKRFLDEVDSSIFRGRRRAGEGVQARPISGASIAGCSQHFASRAKLSAHHTQ